ncbi:MAG: malto-oligosyltrehalose synthase [Acidobacteria bacterium]|nr:malto-oligosyltrehalose synthase [Acidobacteriota bacterium]
MLAPEPERIPVSTYRLQFSPHFTFRDALALVPYLSKLGITECYCSPLFAACPGSPHGYDICDHSRLNPEYGSREDFDSFTSALASHNMGFILDFVPNHMGIDPSANRWWRDVLDSGPSSRYAKYFDIDWDPVKAELKEKVLLPILGDQYGSALENGQLQIRFQDGFFSLQYFDRNLPLNPRQVRKLLRHDLEALEEACQPEDADLREFLSILFHLDHMPAYTETDPRLMLERHREKEIARERLAKLVQESARIRRHIEENIRVFNGQPGDPQSYDLLHDLLEAQAYRLSYWRTALHEINYRRFFDVNELAAIRMEDEEVFQATHSLVLELIHQGVVTGLRLDHVDGLFDPAEYFQRLASSCGSDRRIYLVGEKILSSGEQLRRDWPIHGTTGYDFLNDLNGLFVDSQNAQAFKRLYSRFAGQEEAFADVAYESKRLIITASMVSELNMLARELNRISEVNRRFRDFTLASLQEALREVVACFPAYRTYCSAKGWDEFDRKTVDTAIARALRRNAAMEASIFEFLRQLLQPKPGIILPEEQYQRGVQFAMKFQQYTGPVQAKGLEDTAFYRHGVLVSLNEVGGDPARFGRSPDEFHRANLERLQSWPLSMLATSTHDTKRGEDARARLNVLSEIPREWRAMVFRWSRLNAGMRTLVEGSPAPDRSDEYIFYQSLVSTWPADRDEPDSDYVERVRQFMLKAIREKKVHTSWINPSEAYDSAVAEFVRRTLIGSRAKRFLQPFVPFAKRIAWLGMVNSLSQVVLKIASPGVPDFYQGTELWDLNLVDPDNRRPVDWRHRQGYLYQMEPFLTEFNTPNDHIPAAMELLSNWQDGRIKLFITAAGLRLRRSISQLFLRGQYVPLLGEGAKKDHVVAFARVWEGQIVVAMTPRLVARLIGSGDSLPVGERIWHQTSMVLPPGFSVHSFQNVFTRETLVLQNSVNPARIPVPEALRILPVGIFVGRAQ